jgi:hypothetical protein
MLVVMVGMWLKNRRVDYLNNCPGDLNSRMGMMCEVEIAITDCKQDIHDGGRVLDSTRVRGQQ